MLIQDAIHVINPQLMEKVSGSRALESQIRRLQPEVHIFGHSHLTVDNILEGQRYLQWALGYVNEQKGMSRAVGDTGILLVCLGSFH